MRIETIRLKNFKTFRRVELKDMPASSVFVGANGSGKSTLFDVFGFLKDCLTYNVWKQGFFEGADPRVRRMVDQARVEA